MWILPTNYILFRPINIDERVHRAGRSFNETEKPEYNQPPWDKKLIEGAAGWG